MEVGPYLPGSGRSFSSKFMKNALFGLEVPQVGPYSVGSGGGGGSGSAFQGASPNLVGEMTKMRCYRNN